MIEGRITGLEETRDFIDNLPEEMFDKAKVIFKDRSFAAHKAVTNRLVAGPMHSRTGLLRKSIRPIVSGSTLQNLKAGIFAGRFYQGKEVAYAPIHEYGGEVVARRAYARVSGGPYLNIPATANMTPAGVMRLTAREVFDQGGYIAKMKSGVHGVFLNGKLMFSLHKRVVIPARLGMNKSIDDEIPTLLSQLKDMDLS